jgi:hypothetical protein
MSKRSKQKLTINGDFLEGLKELRHRVENPNKLPSIHLVGSVYKQRDIREVQMLKFPPWEIGYQVLQVPDTAGIFVRNIYCKLPGEQMDELKNEDLDWLLIHLKVLIDDGQGDLILSKIAPDCMKISQHFMPLLLKELKPNLVVPGGTGHV